MRERDYRKGEVGGLGQKVGYKVTDGERHDDESGGKGEREMNLNIVKGAHYSH